MTTPSAGAAWLTTAIRRCERARECLLTELDVVARSGVDIYGETVRNTVALGVPLHVARARAAKVESEHVVTQASLRLAREAVFAELLALRELRDHAQDAMTGGRRG